MSNKSDKETLANIVESYTTFTTSDTTFTKRVDLELESQPKTIFCDIDGTLLTKIGTISDSVLAEKTETQQKSLPGVLDKLNEWEGKGYCIVLTTARPESLRKFTEKQLLKRGIFYHQLVMGITPGIRVLINDKSSNGEEKAKAINVNRNEGLGKVVV